MFNALTFEELKNLCKSEKKPLVDVLIEIERIQTGVTKTELIETVKEMLKTMKSSIDKGLKSAELTQSKMVGDNASKLLRCLNLHSNFNDLYNKILIYAIAVAEENARMGKIVACPTAGSCGIVPSVIVAYSEELNISEEKQIEGLIVGGGIGKFVAHRVSLAGACAGCQAECGVAASMSAAAIVQMIDGDIDKIFNAAALSLKNVLGLTCDPVAGLVEVPCVKRNSFLAIQASVAAEFALSEIQSVIPLDEVVDALSQTGLLMSPFLKETSQGGLATTKTGLAIQDKLNKKWFK